jgi:hypothetical protein
MPHNTKHPRQSPLAGHLSMAEASHRLQAARPHIKHPKQWLVMRTHRSDGPPVTWHKPPGMKMWRALYKETTFEQWLKHGHPANDPNAAPPREPKARAKPKSPPPESAPPDIARPSQAATTRRLDATHADLSHLASEGTPAQVTQTVYAALVRGEVALRTALMAGALLADERQNALRELQQCYSKTLSLFSEK